MSEMSLQKLKGRVRSTVIVVVAVVGISALGVFSELYGMPAMPRPAGSAAIQHLVLTLVLCLVFALLTRLFFSHLSHAHVVMEGQRSQLAEKEAQIDASQQLEKSRMKTLERIATDTSLPELLGCVVEFVEKESPGSLCSILLVDETGTRLRHGAGPSLPAEFNNGLDGVAVGTPFPRQRLIVEEFEAHPFWKGFLPAAAAGLRSCCSEPIFAANGTLLGIIATCRSEARGATSHEIRLIEAAAHLAGIAIARVRTEEGRKILEEQLQHCRKIEAVGQLAAGVAHDFNNLLTPVIVYADMLRRNFEDGTPQARMVDAVGIAAHKASDLTQKLLSFGRKQTLNMNLLDLNEVIVTFREVMRATARDNIEIDLRLSPGTAKVYADRGQLEQVLMNLLLNAQDAIDGNGSVCVETGHLILDEEFARQHPVAKPGHYILLAFSDDGCGMAEETLRHMYEPFFTTKEVGKGTGLGLATVYGIVRRHDGCIDVRSRPGEGTRFVIYLPASASGAEPILGPPPSVHAEVTSGAGWTILLVEDNDMIREVAGELLTSFGYRVLTAETPSKALELATVRGERIHLLATDVIMPEMTGPELYEKLLETHPDLPVLYISGYANGAIDDETQRREAIFLAKPFTLEEFIERIGEMLCSSELPDRSTGALDHSGWPGY